MSQEKPPLVVRFANLFRHQEPPPPPKPIKKEIALPERNPFEFSAVPIPLERAFERPEVDASVQILEDETNTTHSITILAPPRSGGSSFAHQIAEKLTKKDALLKTTKELFVARPLTASNLETTLQQELSDSKISPSDRVCIILEEIESYNPIMKQAIISRLNLYVQKHPGSFLIVLSRKDIPDNEKDIFPQPKVPLKLLDNDSMRRFIKSKMGNVTISPELEDFFVTQTGGHIATAQNIGLTIYEFIKSLPNCSPEQLELFIRSNLDYIFGNLFVSNFQSKAGDPKIITKWFEDPESLSEFDKNRFPRPTATLFRDWVKKQLKISQQSQE